MRQVLWWPVGIKLVIRIVIHDEFFYLICLGYVDEIVLLSVFLSLFLSSVNSMIFLVDI